MKRSFGCDLSQPLHRWKDRLRKTRKPPTPVDRNVVSCDRELIDNLDRRLLYSAEHPLGFATGLADIQESTQQHNDTDLISGLLDSLASEQRNDKDAGRVLDDVTGTEVVIYVTTPDDVVDAPDLSSIAALDAQRGEDMSISLREAVMVANADPTVDRIYLQDDTYNLRLQNWTPLDDQNEDGDLDLYGGYVIEGESEAGVIIQQTQVLHRVFEAIDGNVTLSNLTITGGRATGLPGGGALVNVDASLELDQVKFYGNHSNQSGGAVSVLGHLVLSDVEISGNNANKGGGIYLGSGASVDISNGSQINSNTSDHDGAGIYAVANTTVTMDGGQVNSNTAGNFGGGIYSEGTLVVSDAAIEGNKSKGNGAGIHSLHSLTLDDSSIRGNRVTNDDPGDTTDYSGINNGGGIYSAGIITITNSAINSNHSDGDGAGIYNTGSLAMNNSTVHSNYSIGAGGGLYNLGTTTVEASAVEGNTSVENGAGIYSEGSLNLEMISLGGNRSGANGGGIYISGDADNRIFGTSTISNNNADDNGGGIYLEPESRLTLEIASVFGNTTGDAGGGIYTAGTLEVSNATISENAANSIDSVGGGVANSGTLTMTDSILSMNSALNAGGGLANLDSGDAELERVAIWMNTTESDSSALGGAGIFNSASASLKLGYSVVANNVSAGLAGGIIVIVIVLVESSFPQLIRTTRLPFRIQ